MAGIVARAAWAFAQSLQGQLVVPEGSDIATEILAAAFTILRLLCGAGILAALIGAGLWLLNRKRQRMDEQAETHEDLDTSLGAALASLLRNARARLRNAGAMIGQFGIGSDLLAVISVQTSTLIWAGSPVSAAIHATKPHALRVSARPAGGFSRSRSRGRGHHRCVRGRALR